MSLYVVGIVALFSCHLVRKLRACFDVNDTISYYTVNVLSRCDVEVKCVPPIDTNIYLFSSQLWHGGRPCTQYPYVGPIRQKIVHLYSKYCIVLCSNRIHYSACYNL